MKCYQTIFRVTPQISLHYDTLEIQAQSNKTSWIEFTTEYINAKHTNITTNYEANWNLKNVQK